jgi:hypothetical protein
MLEREKKRGNLSELKTERDNKRGNPSELKERVEKDRQR